MNLNKKKSIVIVGTGMTALVLNEYLKDHFNVIFLEKSRGVGGRMATRRSDESNRKFDHGAQFFKISNQVNKSEHKILMKGVLEPWFEENFKTAYRSRLGFSNLAKECFKNSNLLLDHKLTSLKFENSKWYLKCENGVEIQSDYVILTAPVPQSIELLESNKISYDSELKNISYAKALIGLFEVEQSRFFDHHTTGYVEINSEGIYSMTEQQIKGVSQLPAWTVVMDPEWSEKYFNEPDESNLSHICTQIKKIDPNFKFSSAQLKKWRYSHPLNTYSSLYYHNKNYNLLLAGDGFGGGSLNGAMKSAQSVAELLINLK